ncbi:maleylacetate reductase [Glutamicibacter mysorens]|uniref:Maleylacetate reductase n=1 Tax=Glutamicibacter mysorens TaxID=257984 RepID=A0ABX4N0F4_9MICC|nr:maleylacetate reductase [Glutamicibacter mysorens]PJJ45175.1 maleylacetate reductase [Glutamicibacter mysorens]
MSLEFLHTTLGQRVLFGSGKASQHLVEEVERLGAKRIMVIASGFEAQMAREVAADIDVALWHHEVVMHVPLDVAQRARQTAADNEIDLLVCVGGGSTTGLAKAVAMTTALPIVAVPTTYAGSEATNVWGLTEDEFKRTGVDDKVLPVTVIYDAQLTLSLPVELSIASGLNGMAHCIDSMWGPRVDPINMALSAEGIRALASGLSRITKDPLDLDGREQALYGAYLSAVAFASAGSGIHHKICHVLGGTFNLPHAQTHATVLPYVLAFNAAAAPEAAERIAAALGSDDALDGLQKLRAQLDAPKALADYGFTEADIPLAVSTVLPLIPANNPQAPTEENLTALLSAALRGEDPATLFTPVLNG